MKRRSAFMIASMSLLSTLAAQAQTVRELNFGFPSGTFGRFLKPVNNYTVFLQDLPGLKAQTVHVFDSKAQRVASLDVLSQIDGAEDLSIYDVTVGKSGPIAVAGVAVRRDSSISRELLQSFLMSYDTDGKLLNAVKLNDGPLDALAVDADGSIWGVGHGAGDKDPSSVPLFYKASGDGSKIVGYFPRSDFPGIARKTTTFLRTATVLATLAFGVTSTQVWAWFPTTQEFVVFDRGGENLKKTYTGLPSCPNPALNQVRMGAMGLTEAGDLVCLVGFADRSSGAKQAALYKWRPGIGWQQTPHPGTEKMQQLLSGLDNDELVFRNTAATQFTLSWEKY